MHTVLLQSSNIRLGPTGMYQSWKVLRNILELANLWLFAEHREGTSSSVVHHIHRHVPHCLPQLQPITPQLASQASPTGEMYTA